LQALGPSCHPAHRICVETACDPNWRFRPVRQSPDARRQKLINHYRAHFANPFVAAERGYIADVIIPHETRPRVITALETLQISASPDRSASTGTSRCSALRGARVLADATNDT
jgi:acetyl-CoA carboxylase carboxyltransferase component